MPEHNTQAVVILGAGCYANVLIEVLLKTGKTIVGYVVLCADNNFLLLSSVKVFRWFAYK